MTPGYTVLNPNNIQDNPQDTERVPIISWGEHRWYVGDVLIPPAGMSIERLLRQGYIEEIM